MALAGYKKCSYYDCGENQWTSNDVTYFKFPPHAEKAVVWAERAKVVIDQNLKHKFLCERHFSPIYLNRGIKRTTLVNTAVPYAPGEDETNFEPPVNPVGMRTPRYHNKALSLNADNIETEAEFNITHYTEEPDSEYLDEPEILIETVDVPEKAKINGKRPMQSVDITNPMLLISRQPTKAKKCFKVETTESPERVDEYSNMANAHEEDNLLEIEEYDDNIIPIDEIEDCNEENVAACVSPEPEIPKEYFVFINQGEQWLQLPKRVYLEQCVAIKKLQRDLDTVQNGQQRKMQQLQMELKRYKQFVRTMRCQFDKFDDK